MNKKLFSFIFLNLFLLPITTLADFGEQRVPFAPEGNNFVVDVIVYNIINKTLSLLWVILVVYSVIMFIVAGFQFLSAQGEPQEIQKAQKSLLWGVVGVAVAIVAFSIPLILTNFFGGG